MIISLFPIRMNFSQMWPIVMYYISYIMIALGISLLHIMIFERGYLFAGSPSSNQRTLPVMLGQTVIGATERPGLIPASNG